MATKILFIYNNAFGQYPIIYEYCTNLHDQGYEVSYIGVADEAKEFISEEGIKIFHIAKKDAASVWRLASQINKRSKQIAPDLIHVFHFRWCCLLPLLSISFTKYLLDVRTLHVADSKGKHSTFTFLKNRITWFESQFYRHCIALTTDIRKILSPSYKKIPVIPLGANIEKLQPPDKKIRRLALRDKLSIKNGDLVFLYSGTLSPARKIDMILRAFKEISSSDTWLIIVGDDKDDPQSIINLKKISIGLGIDRQTIFTGFIQYNNLIDYYLAADIGLCYIPQTSYYDLQPPTKLFEYMAAGIVTVATNTTANKNIITDRINGYLSQDSTPELAQTLINVLKEYPRTSPLIINEAYRTVQNFSWVHIIKEYIIPFYKKILDT
jgi:glycosyltransferase involved in cell wall biosynthesis